MTPEFLLISKELKEAREAAGFTVEKLSSVTRIDKKFIQNLESGNFSFLAEVYVKAFIRTISKAINLDENFMMKKFHLAKEGKMPEMAVPVADEKTEEGNETSSAEDKPEAAVPAAPFARHKFQTKEVRFSDYENQYDQHHQKKRIDPKLFILAGGVFVVLFTVYFFFLRSGSEEIIDQTAIEQQQAEEKPRYEESAPETAPAVVPGDSLLVSFEALDSTWIKIDFDETAVKEFYLRPGMSLDAKAKTSLIVLLGNIKGVNISFNNQPVTIDAAGKRVIRIKFDNTGHRVIN